MANNPWFTSVEQTLPQYVPLPFQELMQAGQAVQGRYDENIGALDAAETGLASMEAYAPAHRQFRDKFSAGYRDEASALLDKYNGNAADPQFSRELRGLVKKYQNDPNLGVIQQANEQYKQKIKTRQDLEAKGQKFIDTNPNFTGVDEQGNLTYDVGTIIGTNFDKDIRDQFETAGKAFMNDGSIKTNKQALDNLVANISSDPFSNPATREGLQYYMSQGYNMEQAAAQLDRDIQAAYTSNLSVSKDDMNERLGLSYAASARDERRLNLAEMEFGSKMLAKQNVGTLVAENPIVETKNINDSLIKDVKSFKSRLDDKGNLATKATLIPATPENIAKYPGIEPIRYPSTTGPGLDATPKLRLPAKVANERDAEQLQSMREQLGVTGGTASKIADMYEDYLKLDNNAPTFWNTSDAKQKKGLTDLYFGNGGEKLLDAYIIDRKGNSIKGTDKDINLGDYSNFNYGGMSTSPVSGDGFTFQNGAIKGTAINDKGQIVQIIKPLDPNLTAVTQFTNLIDRATTSGLSNDQLKNNPEFIFPVGENFNVVPQIKNKRVEFYQIDNNGNIIGNKIDDAIVNEQKQLEHNSVGSYYSRFE